MPFAQNLLLTIYYAFLAILVATMLYRAFLVLRYYLVDRNDPEPVARFDEEPVVTVQLPLFNEQFVVERLVERVCALDWPRDKLQVQVLDDSTDDTVAIAAAKVEGDAGARLRRRAPPPYEPHRLQGRCAARGESTQAKGEFLAVFDADFMPEADFLRRTIDSLHRSDGRLRAGTLGVPEPRATRR